MEQWMLDLRNSVTKGETVSEDYDVDIGSVNQVRQVYPMRIPRYYYNLIGEKGDPIWLQSVPTAQELQDEQSPEDPLHEDEDSPVPRLTHRYPDRVLFLDYRSLSHVLPVLHAKTHGRARQRHHRKDDRDGN